MLKNRLTNKQNSQDSTQNLIGRLFALHGVIVDSGSKPENYYTKPVGSTTYGAQLWHLNNYR